MADKGRDMQTLYFILLIITMFAFAVIATLENGRRFDRIEQRLEQCK